MLIAGGALSAYDDSNAVAVISRLVKGFTSDKLPAELVEPTDGLWKPPVSSVRAARAAYREFNFSPSGAMGGLSTSTATASGMRDVTPTEIEVWLTMASLDASIGDSSRPIRRIRSPLGLTRGDRGSGRHQKLLGAGHPRRARPTSTIAACFGAAARGHSARMKFGIERLLADPALRAPLAGKRVALLAHPASVTRDLTHSLDALAALGDITPDRRVRAAARAARRQAGQYDRDRGLDRSGPRNPGVQPLRRGAPPDRADRCRPSTSILIDLQDVGCRIYTFITTLLYMLEAAAEHRQSGVGARPAQPRRAPGRGDDADRRAGRASSAPGRSRCATA